MGGKRLMAKNVLAVLCADIHLSHTAPVARSAEGSWYAAQGRMLDQLRGIAVDHGDIPILCAGDIFHKYNPPPELINWAIKNLPVMYGVAGQHDLPYHDYNERHRSAYMTMVATGNVIDLEYPLYFSPSSRGLLKGASWGQGIKWEKNDGRQSVLLAHKYIWVKGCGYPGAAVDDLAKNMVNQLKGFDVAVFGDNHIPFTTVAGNCVVRNCGCLIPRSQDERDIISEVGLLLEDGTVNSVQLDVSKDKWIEPDDMPREFDVEGMEDFIKELKDSEAEGMDFRLAVERFIRDHDVKKVVADILFGVLEGASNE